jgi:SM-20-related protein
VDELKQDSLPFVLNSGLDLQQLGSGFRISRRLRISNILEPAGAEALYKHLSQDIPWRCYLVANSRKCGTGPLQPREGNVDQDQQLTKLARESARDGYAYLYDANLDMSDDFVDMSGDLSLFTQLSAFLNSPTFLGLVGRVLGSSEIERASAVATRFRTGHFMTFHDATPSADPTGRRVANYIINLTPEWRPEWGGMLEFRELDGQRVDAYIPCFNSLDLYAFPQGHWISAVSCFASGPRYAISGSLFGR